MNNNLLGLIYDLLTTNHLDAIQQLDDLFEENNLQRQENAYEVWWLFFSWEFGSNSEEIKHAIFHNQIGANAFVKGLEHGEHCDLQVFLGVSRDDLIEELEDNDIFEENGQFYHASWR